MNIEFCFHNSYHYKGKETAISLTPDEDYDDHLHYPEPLPETRVTTIESVAQEVPEPFDIEDLNNEIQSIETNNPKCIKISTKIKKGLFKKVKTYNITFNNQGNGFLKIKYKGDKPMEIKSFYGSFIDNSIKLGSLSGHDPDYWLKDDPFISNKYIDCMYSYSNTKVDIENHINVCYKMGAECKFVYQKFTACNLENSDFVSHYINNFIEYVEFIYKTNPKGLQCTIIYEPDLLIPEIYNSGNNNIYISADNTKITLVQFISQMQTVCENKSIQFVNVFNPSAFNEIISQVTDIDDFDRYVDILKNKALHVAEYLSYFKNKNTKYLAFKYLDSKLLSNDQHLAYLVVIRSILETLHLEGIIFNIPVGHVNSLDGCVSRYTNKPYNNHTDKPGDYQSTATLFFFGGCATFNDYKFHQNKFQDTGLIVNGDTIYCDEHVSLCDTFNIKYLMFGPNSPEDTTNVPLKSRGNKCTDHHYTITKLTEYYNKR